jgi:hypothetical protein
LAGATDENIEDVKQLAELSSGYAKFLKEIEYDFDKWKEEVTAAHEFIASKMGG